MGQLNTAFNQLNASDVRGGAARMESDAGAAADADGDGLPDDVGNAASASIPTRAPAPTARAAIPTATA